MPNRQGWMDVLSIPYGGPLRSRAAAPGLVLVLGCSKQRRRLLPRQSSLKSSWIRSDPTRAGHFAASVVEQSHFPPRPLQLDPRCLSVEVVAAAVVAVISGPKSNRVGPSTWSAYSDSCRIQY